jgi:hypothetical protein
MFIVENVDEFGFGHGGLGGKSLAAILPALSAKFFTHIKHACRSNFTLVSTASDSCLGSR